MFDSSVIVQSAASSFNNAALASPDFFWGAILCIPVFAAAWVCADKFAKYIKWFPTVIIAAISIWLLSHESFAVLRDQSMVGFLAAACIFACTAYLTRRFLELFQSLGGAPFSDRRQGRLRRSLPYLAPIAVIAIAGLCGAPSFAGFALQGGAAAIGMLAGWLLHKQNRAEYQPNLVAVLLFLAISLGLVMQPEFFRFGKLGELTALHMAFLAAAAAAFAANIALRLAKPAGWLKESVYKKVRILTRLAGFLTALLFILTESPIAFIAFGLTVLAMVFINAKHAKTKLSSETEMSWKISLGLFGVLTGMPVLVCLAIVLWRAEPSDALSLKKLF